MRQLPIKFLGLLFSDILNFDVVYNNNNHPASVLNLEASFTQFFLIQELMIFLQTSVKVLRSKVNVLIFLGLSQKECVCYVCYVTCVTLCGTHPKMTPRDILIGLAGLI